MAEPVWETVRADGPWKRLDGVQHDFANCVRRTKLSVRHLELRNPVIANGRGTSIRRFATGVERESAVAP